MKRFKKPIIESILVSLPAAYFTYEYAVSGNMTDLAEITGLLALWLAALMLWKRVFLK